MLFLFFFESDEQTFNKKRISDAVFEHLSFKKGWNDIVYLFQRSEGSSVAIIIIVEVS